MSHSQFHCTGRAYLDMHGLIFETSICYWQDQPGREGEEREHPQQRGPGVPGRGAAAERGSDAPAGGSRTTTPPPPERASEAAAAAGRPTPGPDRQPAPPAARADDRTTPGRTHEGPRRDAAPWRHRGWGRSGDVPGTSSTSCPPHTHHNHTTPARPATSAARERGHGHREVARRPAGACPLAPARSPARADGAGGGRRGSGLEARHPDPLPARPPDGRERGGADTAAGPRRLPGDPTTHARASAPGRAGARRGGGDRRTAFRPHPRPTRNRRRRTGGDGGGPRSGTAAGPRSEAPRGAARGSADATDAADGRTWERGPTRRAAGSARRRGDATTTSPHETRRRRGGRREATRRREGARGPSVGHGRESAAGARHGVSPPEASSAGAVPRHTTQDADWPPPRPPQPQGPPSRGSRPPTTTAVPARAATTLSRTHTGRPAGPPYTHTPLRRARLPHPASGTVSTPPGDAAGRGGRGGDTLTWARPARSQRTGGGKGSRRGGGGLGPAATGRGAAARTHAHSEGRGAGARGALPRERKGRGHDRATRKTSAGSHRHTHEGGPTTPETPAGPSHPGASHDPAPPPGGPRVRRSPRVARRDPSAQTPHLNVLAASTCIQVRPPGGSCPGATLPSEATRTVPTHRPPPAATSGQGKARRAPRGCGTGEPGRPGVPSPPPRAPHHRGRRAHTRAHGPAPDAGLAGPSPDSEGGGAGRGRQRAALGPTAGPARAHPPAEARDSCPRALAVALVATARLGGAAAGGSGTPRLPLGSLEKAFSPRGRHPPPIVSPPSGPRRRSTSRRRVHDWAGVGFGGRSAVRGGTRPKGASAATARGHNLRRAAPGLVYGGLRKEGVHTRGARQKPPFLTEAPRPNTIAPTPVCHALATLKSPSQHTPCEDDGDEAAPVPSPHRGGEREREREREAHTPPPPSP